LKVEGNGKKKEKIKQRRRGHRDSQRDYLENKEAGCSEGYLSRGRYSLIMGRDSLIVGEA
jgi:hypothetical protein